MCMDNVTNTKKAVKISKDRPLFFERAMEEIKILQKLQTLDADKCSLRKHNALPIAEIRPVLRQLTTALLHLEALEIIHADIKPENIMVVNRLQHPLQVKLIDFGLARHVSEAVPGTAVQSLWYRAPEVLLGMDFSEQIDMWPLGATPWEFALQTGHHFRGNQCFHLRSLDDLVEVIPYRHMTKREELLNFVDLLKSMLVPDKCRRIIPLTVLEHRFFAVEQDPEVSQSIETVIVDMREAEQSLPPQPSLTESFQSIENVIFDSRDSELSVTLQLSKNVQSVAFKAVTLPEQTVSAQPETVYFKLEDEAAHMEPEVIKVTSDERKSRVRRFLKSIYINIYVYIYIVIDKK
ncbi:hypothetical protein JOQ06_013359 [Pogonophryne albipinna]|uniref:Protein kinase domain-containing protein n=1 Tax=Pogonophryne albipinna TaxID=1090488 RepID=A0AAD6BJJ9_9TELE|nr:hypothetical protein JOQ06_013359 [Pogonophryne albipinna]